MSPYHAVEPSASGWTFYECHFGASRLRHYLAHSGQDRARAAHLYDWNVAVSAAFWEALSYFEVAFRNAIDGRMSARNSRLGRNGHWIFDDHRELGRDGVGPGKHRQPYKDIDEAIRRVRANHKPIIAGQVISELSSPSDLVRGHQRLLRRLDHARGIHRP